MGCSPEQSSYVNWQCCAAPIQNQKKEICVSLEGRVVVVSGGAGLLGGKFCSAISSSGGISIVADVNKGAADEVADKIRSSNGESYSAQLDIADTDSVERLIAAIHSKHGRIDAVVNNAYPRNKNWGRKLEDVVYSDFCENVGLHLGGYFLVAQKFAMYFQSCGGGNIINMSSIYGLMAPKFEIYEGTSMTVAVEYAAIKSAIIQLTRYFAQYFKSHGIRCNAISPGGIFDNQQESFLRNYNARCGIKGMLDANDIAGALIFLLSEESRHMTGQNLVVDDGFSL
jgi:NAD(P)-dependent dehydrogenase (short-subunit alcohol dehydrogenase family)